MEIQAKKNLLTRLESNALSSDELVILAVPLSLPYPIIAGAYESADGEFLHEGQYYKLVKRKFANDTLFIMCVKDQNTAKINKTLADYTKVANNIPVGAKQALNFLGKLYKDYHTSEFKYFYLSRELFTQSFIASASQDTIERISPVDSPPPEV